MAIQQTAALHRQLTEALDALGQWLHTADTPDDATSDTAWLGWDGWVRIGEPGSRDL